VFSPPRSRLASVVPRTRPAIAPSGAIHQQRQNARHDGVGPVSEADQLQDQQCGEKACDRTNHPAGDLQRIFHGPLDEQSKASCHQGSPGLSGLAGDSFNAFEGLIAILRTRLSKVR
jgi:hypothetical protein